MFDCDVTINNVKVCTVNTMQGLKTYTVIIEYNVRLKENQIRDD